MMGRTRDGRALAAPELGNDFDYSGDPGGAKCPFGAHVRRANPRDEGEHRLLRRGIPFGPTFEQGPANAERGLYFIAFNASIENQFEFMQRFYMNGDSDGMRATGNVNDGRDPVGASGAAKRRMAIEGDGAARSPVLLLDIPAFVTCRGGQYYLMPSIAGLEMLSRHPKLRLVPGTGEAQEGARP
jgi:Dyp-type peroxidase family